MTIRQTAPWACVLAALLFAPLAHAEDVALSEAKMRFKEGLAYADGMKFEEARLKFLQAFVVLKAPAVLFNLASAEQKTGHDLDAIEHYRALLRGGVSSSRGGDAMRERAQKNVDELLAKVGQVALNVPENAQIFVDGKPVELSPKETLVVLAGKHTFEAALDGKFRSVSVTVNRGEIVNAQFDFRAMNEPTGEVEATRSVAGWAVPAGLGALGIVGVVAGGVFGAASQSSKDESEALRRDTPGPCGTPESPACKTYDDKRSTAESQATAAWIGYVSGGALLAGAVATLVLWPVLWPTKPSSPLRGTVVSPMLGAHGTGASFTVSF